MIFAFSKTLGFLVLLIGVSAFLVFLPSTGSDYIYYQDAYQNAYWTSEFPWFLTSSILTAEPGYLWYSSAVSVLTFFSFSQFLALNFIICVVVFLSVVKMRLSVKLSFWIYSLPVIVPTIFYWSPRSSISFIFALSVLVFLSKKKWVLALTFSLLAITVHSQYLPVLLFCWMAYCFVGNSYYSWDNKYIYRILALAAAPAAVLFLLPFLFSVLEFLLSWLPSSGVAISKLHYLRADASEGFRITSILSILVFPMLYYLLIKEKNLGRTIFFEEVSVDNIFTLLLLAALLFGLLVNLIFINHPHVSGRLSRLSDYLGFSLVIPSFLHAKSGRLSVAFAALFLCILSPIFYPIIYDFYW